MNAEQLKQLQAPLKARYREAAHTAVAELRAHGVIDISRIECTLDSLSNVAGKTTSGLHPKAGGSGHAVCSGDMLLQSLVACSGVTFAAVATAMNLRIDDASVSAVGLLDFRGTLGVDRQTPAGFIEIRLIFDVKSEEPADSLNRLIELTDRYCVVLQTLKQGVPVITDRTQ